MEDEEDVKAEFGYYGERRKMQEATRLSRLTLLLCVCMSVSPCVFASVHLSVYHKLDCSPKPGVKPLSFVPTKLVLSFIPLSVSRLLGWIGTLGGLQFLTGT